MPSSSINSMLAYIASGVDRIRESASEKVTEARENMRALADGVMNSLGEMFEGCEFRKTGRVQYPFNGLALQVMLAGAAGKLSRVDIAKWIEDSQYQLAEIHPDLCGCPSTTLIGRMMQSMPKELVEKAFARLNGNFILEKTKKDGTFSATDIAERLVISIDGQLILATQILLEEQPTEESMWKRSSGKTLVTMYCANYSWAINQRTCSKKNQEAKCAIDMIKELQPFNAIFTADAANCNVDLSQTIVKYNNDYLLALKSNSGKIYHETVKLFDKESQRMGAHQATSEDLIHGVVTTNAGGHNLFVQKTVSILPVKCLPDALQKKYANMKSLIRIVTSTNNLTTRAKVFDHRYFVSSLSADKNDPNSAWKFSKVKLMEWSVETQHKYLDCDYRQDRHAYRIEQSASNSAWFTKTCLNCLLAKERYQRDPERHLPVLPGACYLLMRQRC